MLDIPTVGIVPIVPVPKRSAFETSLRELSEDLSFGIGTLFGCRAIGLGKPPQGRCDIRILPRNVSQIMQIRAGVHLSALKDLDHELGVDVQIICPRCEIIC